MERVIKFRGKTGTIWVEGYFVKDYEGTAYITTLDGVDTYVVDEKTVSYFTGLTDKNGKEIYEGDRILLWNFYKASGTTAEWFGAEPQNSKYIYEEYLETMEAVIVFIDGSFVAKNANHEIPLISVVKGLGEEVSWHYMCGMGGSEKEFIEGFIDDWEHYYDELESLEEESFYKRLEEIVNEITTEIKVIGNIFENPELLSTDKTKTV